MTERQILLHYEAELRRRLRERAEGLIDMNLAFVGGDAAEEHRQQLTR